jgi:predicted anti-sigma-YlaC factor YlaD
MTTIGCEMARERIPDWVGGRLAPSDSAEVSFHADGCDDCRAEAELVALLSTGRPNVPAGLADDLRAAVRYRRSSVARPWWGALAAGVAALALGIGVSSGDGMGEVEIPAFAASTEEAELWLSDDGLIAGAPALEDLSDEALLTLLEELGAGDPG